MAELPHGTVTFAFTDIEGSTALLKRLGDSYAHVLSDHRRLVRETFTGHGGVEIDTQGDAFFFAFVRAREAVAGAAAVQRAHVAHAWPPGAEVRMRVGLHTGEPTVGDEGYLGLDVVRAARLCGACRGGHVLLSETTRALVGSALPPGVSVFPLGERHLKDLDEPERVFELEIEGVAVAPPATEPEPPAPAPGGPPAGEPERKARQHDWEAEFERRVEAFAGRTAESVLGKLERSLGRLGRGAQEPEDDQPAPAGGGVEDLAAHADALARRIELEIRLARKGDRGRKPR